MGEVIQLKHEVTTAEVDGIEVAVDLTWCRSWEGIAAISRMERKGLTDAERLVTTVDYYLNACPNIDEVSEALQARSESEVTAADVMAFVAGAVREVTPKN